MNNYSYKLNGQTARQHQKTFIKNRVRAYHKSLYLSKSEQEPVFGVTK